MRPHKSAAFGCDHASSRSGSSVLRLLASLVVSLLLAHSPALAQVTDPIFPITNGSVSSMAMGGDTLYVGGSFTWIGSSNGGMVALDAVTGAPIKPWPRVLSGRRAGLDAFFVFARVSLPDGQGGCYVGGSFQTISGVARSGLAHIRADGSLDGWAPSTNSSVQCMAQIGNTIFVGGQFSSANGQPRAGVAAFDANTGALRAWNANATGYVNVTALETDGTNLIVGGSFGAIGGQVRNGLAMLDPATALATSWAPNPNSDVSCMALANGILYVGGSFSSIGGKSRVAVAALDPVTGQALTWDAGANRGAVAKLSVTATTVYLTGFFTQLGGLARPGIGAVDAGTGAVTGWSPNLDQRQALALMAADGVVYLGGNFKTVNGQSRSCLAAVDPVTGAPTAWNPGASQQVESIVSLGGRVFVTGQFSGCGGQTCTGLASIDTRAGKVLDWRPALDGGVSTLIIHGERLYVGGAFRHAAGQTRGGLAAFERASGQLDAWNPGGGNANTISLLATNGPRVYVAGSIQSLGGSGPRELVALDRTTGLATAWNLTYTSSTSYRYLSRLIATDDRVYMGGEFHSVNGQPRVGVAAVDGASGATLAWNAGLTSYVDEATLQDTTLFLTGGFTSVGGKPRDGAAAVSTGTGLATAWSPNPSWRGSAMAVTDSVLYFGFSRSYLDPGSRRNSVVAFDARTGVLQPWYPHVSTYYEGLFPTLLARAGDLYVGGQEEMLAGDESRPGLARIRPNDAQQPSIEVLSPAAGASLIIGSECALTWHATDNQSVASCDVYLSRTGSSGPWELLAAAVTGAEQLVWRVSAPPTGSTCWLRVDARDQSGNVRTAIGPGAFEIISTTAVELGSGNARFELVTPTPSPTTAGARVVFVLPSLSRVRLSVQDIQGREVGVLLEAELPAGRHERRVSTVALPPGLYFVSLRVPGHEITRRLVVVH